MALLPQRASHALVLVGIVVAVALRAEGRNDRDPRDGTSVAQEQLSTTHGSVALLRLGDSETPLYQVRGAKILEDGIVIAESGTGRIRFYDLQGREKSSIGRNGSGPGEFTRVEWLQWLGDTLYVGDQGQRTVLVFDGKGDFVRTIRFDPPTAAHYLRVEGALVDGSILTLAVPVVGAASRPGTARTEARLWRYSPIGEPVSELGSVLGTELYTEPNRRGGEFVTRIPFGRTSAVVPFDSGYVTVDNNTASLSYFRYDGTVRGQLAPTGARANAVLTKADRRGARRAFLGGAIGTRTRRKQFHRMDLPLTRPPFGNFGRPIRMLGGNDSYVWVLHFATPQDIVWKWSIFDSRFKETEVTTPSDTELLDVSMSRILLKRWNEYDVEFVELHQAVRESPWLETGPRRD